MLREEIKDYIDFEESLLEAPVGSHKVFSDALHRLAASPLFIGESTSLVLMLLALSTTLAGRKVDEKLEEEEAKRERS